MPFLFILLKRRNRWNQEAHFPWVEPEDVPADPIQDLASRENKLSVWHVESDKSNLERVVAAVASGRNDLSSEAAYALFADDAPGRLGIRVENSQGASLDSQANQNWHRNLAELSGRKLVKLTGELLAHAEIDRKFPREVAEAINRSIESGFIQRETVRQSLLDHISRLTS